MGRFLFNPFKKNRYFYGKRLNVSDFKTEQSYMDAKRHMLNRNVTGAGVVYGLNVSAEEGSQTLCVSSGLALDGFGREIVVPPGMRAKLSDIPGAHHGQATASGNYLLCIQYDELTGEPAAKTISGEHDYGRILEGYRLEVKRVEDIKAASIPNLFYKPVTVFENEQVSLTRLAPAWVNPNEVFRVMFVAERKEGAAEECIELQMSEAFYRPGSSAKDSTLMDFYKTPGSSPSLTMRLEAGQKRSYCSYMARSLFDPYPGCEEAASEIRMASFASGAGKGIRTVNAPSLVLSVATPISERFLEEYFKKDYMDLFPMADGEYVYLAEINVKQAKQAGQAAAPVVKVVDGGALPDRNRGHVYNNTLLYQLIRNIEARMAYQKMPPILNSVGAKLKYDNSLKAPDVRASYAKLENKLDLDFRLPGPSASGVVVFDVYSELLEKGDYEISESIRLGPALNVASVQVAWDRSRFSDKSVAGDKLMYGVEPNTKDGTFKIWYKAIERFKLPASPAYPGGGGSAETVNKKINQLHFRWWAFGGMDMATKDVRAQTLALRPKRLNLSETEKTAEFQVYLKGSLTEDDKYYPAWSVFDRDNNLIRQNYRVFVTRVRKDGGHLYKLDVEKDFPAGTDDFILECTYKTDVARAYVSINRKDARPGIKFLNPPAEGQYVTLTGDELYTIKWAYAPGVERYKINVRRNETSAIMYSETVPGDVTSVTIRGSYFSFSEFHGAACTIDIFAYYTQTDYRHKACKITFAN